MRALRVWLIAIDQLICVTLVLPAYLRGLAPLPNPRETLSSLVGRRATLGQGWALKAERLLDSFFEALGDPPGHCRNSIIPEFQT